MYVNILPYFQTTCFRNLTLSPENSQYCQVLRVTFSPSLSPMTSPISLKQNSLILTFLQLKGQASVNTTGRGGKHIPTPFLG